MKDEYKIPLKLIGLIIFSAIIIFSSVTKLNPANVFTTCLLLLMGGISMGKIIVEKIFGEPF